MAPVPGLEALPVSLLAEPINWLFAEHYRHRQLCALIEGIGSATVLPTDQIEQVIAFLQRDMALHVIDEEDDLFPLLRRRCDPEDNLGQTLGILSAEHSRDLHEARRLIDRLHQALQSERPLGNDPAARRQLLDFANHERRHIALENAIVLPIARLRLSRLDLEGLSRRMAARRGLDAGPAEPAGSAA